MSIFAENYNVYSFLLDLAFASGFVLIGQLLRAKIKFFQSFFIPASLIAGFLGLILGPRGFGFVPFSDKMGSYSGMLIVLVFVSIGLRGFKISREGFKKDVERIGSYMCFKEVSYMLQYFVPILFGVYVLNKMFSNIPPGFGMILGAGFVGGHGTAAAVGRTFAEYGWADATDLAMTSATIGILTGIFGGVLLIKWATKKGITSYTKDFGKLPEELRTGLIPKEKRISMCDETVSPISIDPLGWHLALILLPAGLGKIAANLVNSLIGLNVPTFSMAFLVAVLFYYILKSSGVYKYVDRKLIGRLGSTFTDYLVFFGIASIRLPVVIKYIGPFTLLMVLGIFIVVGGFLFFARRMNKVDWFERSIFVYGYCTGAFAIGFALLRIVDPDMKSKTLDDTAILTPIFSITDITMISLAPILLSTGKIWALLVPVGAYLVFFLLLSRIMKWWYPSLPLLDSKIKLILKYSSSLLTILLLFNLLITYYLKKLTLNSTIFLFLSPSLSEILLFAEEVDKFCL
ncbi:Sodium/glutamate symporter [subsurface metagenome]